jgi:hypothetical protein
VCLASAEGAVGLAVCCGAFAAAVAVVSSAAPVVAFDTGGVRGVEMRDETGEKRGGLIAYTSSVPLFCRTEEREREW